MKKNSPTCWQDKSLAKSGARKSKNSVIISGYGGQGILLAGIMLSKAAMQIGKFVTWLPSYGAQMRGGTANCAVVVSDDEISSPMVNNPDFVIALNPQSVEKFENEIKEGGTIFVNSDIKIKKRRKDINYFLIPANKIAKKIGEIRCANLVMLGAFLQKTNLINLKVLEDVIMSAAKSVNKKIVMFNKTAIDLGADFIKSLKEEPALELVLI